MYVQYRYVQGTYDTYVGAFKNSVHNYSNIGEFRHFRMTPRATAVLNCGIKNVYRIDSYVHWCTVCTYR